MAEIGIVDAIAAVRSELRAAVVEPDGDIQFPIDGVELEFKVVVTKELRGDGKVNVWVLELSGGVHHEEQAVHTVRLRLGAPVDLYGRTVKVVRTSTDEP